MRQLFQIRGNQLVDVASASKTGPAGWVIVNCDGLTVHPTPFSYCTTDNGGVVTVWETVQSVGTIPRDTRKSGLTMEGL